MEPVSIVIFAIVGYVAWRIYQGYSERHNLVAAKDVMSQPMPVSPHVFDVYRDSRGDVSIFGFPVKFSTDLEPEKYPNIVTGITLNQDFVAVWRGAYGVRAFLLNEQLTVTILPGCPPGFLENSDYLMQLESETELARFPLSFVGWLQIVDAARRRRATIEIDPALPDRLKELIETPLPGDESIQPVRTKGEEVKNPSPRAAGRCRSCGANIGRKTCCDYCGAKQ